MFSFKASADKQDSKPVNAQKVRKVGLTIMPPVGDCIFDRAQKQSAEMRSSLALAQSIPIFQHPSQYPVSYAAYVHLELEVCLSVQAGKGFFFGI